MIKYIVFILLFLLKISFIFGQNEDSLFHVITKKHKNTPYYTIIKDELNTHIKDEYKKDIIYSYEFVQRKHKDKIFVFVTLSSSITQYYRYRASRKEVASQFDILDKNEYYFWNNIELIDLNNDNIREIVINYENGYPKHSREVYNFSTDSIAPVILKSPYDDGILTCIDSTKNLYFTIHRSSIRGGWSSELFVINKDFSKGIVLGKAEWDYGHMCDNCFYINGEHPVNPYTNYFFSQSKSVIYNFHPNVNRWDSKENIEFMKNAYLKMIQEFDIEY
ncbi:hypothetical protein WAF17_19155 [Bernardetia sp. ABR2-2B]|uniref:hypothetical protein n=1 Tax=Bernardetia sp. ABR2-2B TaxID=3127472 RepID=UPI0030CC7A3B